MTSEEKAEEAASNATQGEGESNSTCMICMEEWTIGSEHRVCSLKCGHLFGRSCIERWIKEKGASANCPTCNKTAKRPDLRDLWCKSIRATDNTELVRLQQLLDSERNLRRTDSAIIFHQNLKLEMLFKDLDRLKAGIIQRDEKIAKLEAVINRFNQLRAQRANNIVDETESNDATNTEDGDVVVIDVEPRELKGMFHLAQKLNSSPTGGCRSFALCPTASIVVVAQPNPQSTRHVFGGFGLKKYSTLDTSIREFIPLHSKAITSIQLKPVGDLILTSSQDRRVHLTSICNNTRILSYQCQYEPTCVSWSTHRDQQFYVASGNCFVTLYDIRNTSEYIYQTNQKIANSRVLSIASTSCPDGLNGLLVNDVKGSLFLEISESSSYDQENIDRSEEHMKNYQLPFDGLMGTVDYNKRLDLALISTRRSPVEANCMHNLVRLKKVQSEDGSDKIDCQRVKTFVGSRPGELLSQSRILKHPTLDDSVLVCACDQGANGVKLWDTSDNTEYQTIASKEFVRDMIMHSPEHSNQHILYILNDMGLNIYRWDYA